MAALKTDKFIKGSRKLSGNLDASGIINASVDNFGLNSASGLPTDTAIEITIDRVDANGVKTPTKEEVICGVVSGNRIIDCDRGVEGTAQAHSAGAVWEIRLTASQWNKMIAGILAEHNQDGTHKEAAISTPIHAATSKATPVDADEIGLVDSAATFVLKKLTWANLKATLKTYFDALYVSVGSDTGGWTAYSDVIPTRASADDPTYVLTFAGVDLTSKFSIGMRIKFTQNSATLYGIVTAKAFSTNTTLTIYCGTDYDVLDTATYPISNFYYSFVKAPVGFPLDPIKWSVRVTDATRRSQGSPGAGTWYNIGTTNSQITIPIGAWEISYQVMCGIVASGLQSPYITLSTANNSESDTEMTTSFILTLGSSCWYSAPFHRRKKLVLTSKTLHYLNAKTGGSGNINIDFLNDYSKLMIEAVCAYL